MTASIKTIRSYFHGILHSRAPVTMGEARAIRAALELGEQGRDGADKALEILNGLLDGHGIEAIRGDYHVDNYYGEIVALYVNMGETYAMTALLETDTGKFLLTSYGDWVERNQRKYRIT